MTAINPQMDHTLRCNNSQCRAELARHAVVTTCSHIFCLDCESRLKLSNSPDGQRPVCPVCGSKLNNPDDAVVTNLIPTEDYKASVLSGLNPNVIMECASKALSFWTYQLEQDIVFQAYIASSLADKYSSLNLQMDKIIHDANAEMSDLRAKMNNMAVEQDNLRRKNEELAQAFREKSRTHLQTQELYDKLKRRAMLGQVQNAASNAVDYTIQASTASNRFIDPEMGGNEHHQKASLSTELQHKTREQSGFGSEDSTILTMPPPTVRGGFDEGWSGFNGHEINHQASSSVTPSSHRQRLAGGVFTGMGLAGFPTSRTTSAPVPQRRRLTSQQPLTSLSPNGPSNQVFSGYGMSAGVKVSQPPAVAQSPASAAGRPTIRSRVAQRPGTTSITDDQTPAFRPSSGANSFSQLNGYY